MAFDSVFRDKRVLVTGHTGFKGSWLTSWLSMVGAEICGVSLGIPTEPSMFEILRLDRQCHHHLLDIRDGERLQKIFTDFAPEFVFHLAAQAIVARSYADPLTTIATNTLGTAQVLQALRHLRNRCVAVFITSDKCYENVEWVWGYRETDALGGKDIYSASKAGAEAVIHAYHHSFFSDPEGPIRLARARAGNVIGGGDWAPDRIVADCARAWSEGKPVTIRSPRATRPWQHVLEPLSGYLTLAAGLAHPLGEQGGGLQGEAFNFGPPAEQNRTVLDLLQALALNWGFKSPEEAFHVMDHRSFSESGLLKLNSDKASQLLGWQTTWTFEECAKNTAQWYKGYYDNPSKIGELTRRQIQSYQEERVRIATAKRRSLIL